MPRTPPLAERRGSDRGRIPGAGSRPARSSSVPTEHTAHAEGPSALDRTAAATVEFVHVAKRYPGQAEPAIRDLSFTVPAGEVCVLVGPSGCGKTTAMRLVNRMIELTSGDILLDGQSIKGRDTAALRREIGYAIQQVGLFPHVTVGENIATVPKLLGWDKRRTRERTDELLDLVGLEPEMRKRYPAQLSGGQRQRVGVARALAADPPLMLMDEPFGSLDPITRSRLQDEFLRLQNEIRKTVLFVTHDIDEAIKMGDRIAVLRRGGELAQFATPADLLMHPADEFVEQFVGADRALKRLALTRVRELDLRVLMAEHERDGHPRIAEDVPLRDALAELLQAGRQEGIVVDAAGRERGVISIDLISRSLEQPA
jgi:osmoprotectant transport system ATP-binding protein